MNSLPTQNFVGFIYVAPYLFDIAFTTGSNFVVKLNAGALFESVNQFKNAHTVTGTYVVDFNTFFIFVLNNAFHSSNVCLGQVEYIDVVADARTVGGVIVITEHFQAGTDAHSCLREVGDEVGRNTIRHFTDDATGV